MIKHAWVGTTLRVTKPTDSIAFYERHFGMKLVTTLTRKSGVSYFLVRPRDSETLPTVNSDEATAYIFSLEGNNFLELFHENDLPIDFKPNNGNVEPHRGFGHIAFNVMHLEAFCDQLEIDGVRFQKKLTEGTMKTLAFVLDPDNYWVEVCGRSGASKITEKTNLSQSMIRVKDLKKSLAFYEQLGMVVGRKISMPTFSLYFLFSPAYAVAVPSDFDGAGGKEFCNSLFHPILELTHNNGTETQDEFRYHTGNTEPKGFVGLTFFAQGLDKLVPHLENELSLKCKLQGGTAEKPLCVTMTDPDSYCVRVFEFGDVACPSIEALL
eukprot:Lankesteria_metandrocarpae@DN5312_c0_g4_i1.p1